MDLKKQLETTETTIKALQDYAESLRSMLEKEAPKKWSPVGGTWHIDTNGIFCKSIPTKNCREFGTERSTKEQAERAAVEMRKFNRLLALRDELCGNDGNWLAGKNNYWVYYDYEEDNYGFCSNSIMQTIGLVYFTSEQTVKRACDMLNSGEVEL